MDWVEIGYIAIGIIATLIGGVIMKIFEFSLNKLGRVSVHCKIVEKTKEYIKMKIEIENNTNDTYFMRQFNLCAENDGLVIPLLPGNFSENSSTKNKEYFANEGFYSFAVSPKSLQHYILFFVFDRTQPIDKIDSMFCQYLTGKESKIELSINHEIGSWQLLQKRSLRKSRAKKQKID